MHALIYKSEDLIRTELQAFWSVRLNDYQNKRPEVSLINEQQLKDFKRINFFVYLISYIHINE